MSHGRKTNAGGAGLTKVDASRAIDAAIAEITKTLKKEESVTLVGFGTFKVTHRATRNGRTHVLVLN